MKIVAIIAIVLMGAILTWTAPAEGPSKKVVHHKVLAVRHAPKWGYRCPARIALAIEKGSKLSKAHFCTYWVVARATPAYVRESGRR